VAGDTAKTVRDILQAELLGKPSDPTAEGTGLIPAETIIRTTPKHGLADAVESLSVRHTSGGVSVLHFKSYDQGREAFQGTSQHFVHLDEDCAQEIYAECLLRLLTTEGTLYWTATLVEGLTPLMLDYLPNLRPSPDV
jgi:phage terminase large subunit-like protein